MAGLYLPQPVADETFRDEFGFVFLEDGSVGPFYVSMGGILADLWHRHPEPAACRADVHALLQLRRLMDFLPLNNREKPPVVASVDPPDRDVLKHPPRDPTEPLLGGREWSIIAATAHVFDQDRDQCNLAGMDDFISKPIRQQKLAEIFARWLPDAKVLEAKTA